VIFVTVGTQRGFDRLIAAVDTWAAKSGAEVYAQTGPTSSRFPHLQCAEFLDPVDFDRRFSEASLVVAHAGMGSVLTALEHGKPLIVMPRKVELGEHRNDHQMATAKKLQGNSAVHIAWNEAELSELLSRHESIIGQSHPAISSHAPLAFLEKLREIIDAPD